MGSGEEMTGLSAKAGEPCLLFSLAGETYAIRIAVLREIVSPAGMRPLSPSDYLYWDELNFRGGEIPVLRLSDFFEYPSRHDVPKSVLVIGPEGTQFGLLVDGVKGVWSILGAELKPLPRLATHLDPQYVRGIGKVEGIPVFLLNEDALSKMNEISSYYRV